MKRARLNASKIATVKHKLTLDILNLSSGLYFYQLKAGSFIQTKKLVLLK